MELSKRIRDLRYAKGWGPDELASRAKISRTALYQIERGNTSKPQAGTLRRISRALGVPLEALLAITPMSSQDGSGEQPEIESSAFAPAPGVPGARVLSPDRAGELMEKFRLLLGSPLAEGVARIVEESFRLLPIIPPPAPGESSGYAPAHEIEPMHGATADRVAPPDPIRIQRWRPCSHALGGIDAAAASVRRGPLCAAGAPGMDLDAYESLRARIGSNRIRVGIIGLGYVGLPLALAFARQGLSVLGFDTDPIKVNRLARGESYIGHIPGEAIREAAGRFEATHQFSRLDEPDAILICVPTPLSPTRDPDLAYVAASARAIAARLRTGQLIVLESTTYPGTTRQVVLPLLDAAGLRAGIDYFLAYSPEREDPGNPRYSAPTIPKVIGGLDPRSLELATELYARVVVRVVPVSSLEVAEACKILENTYRAVNIALVNELKLLYDRMGIDVWEVIEAARTKPFGFQAFYPGPGLGGHCIPIDPFYLTWIAREHGMAMRFIELAGEINTSMPGYVVSRVADALNDRGKPVKGSRILLLGMAYKKDVNDPRESPGFELMDLLLKKGAIVEYNDPHIPVLPAMRRYPHLQMQSQELTPEYLGSRDCVLIVTDHTVYDWAEIVRHSSLVVDTRNATQHIVDGRERIIRA